MLTEWITTATLTHQASHEMASELRTVPVSAPTWWNYSLVRDLDTHNWGQLGLLREAKHIVVNSYSHLTAKPAYIPYCPNRGWAYILFRSFWPSRKSCLPSIWARLLLSTCIRYKNLIHVSYIDNPYEWLPLTSVCALFSRARSLLLRRVLPFSICWWCVKVSSLLVTKNAVQVSLVVYICSFFIEVKILIKAVSVQVLLQVVDVRTTKM